MGNVFIKNRNFIAFAAFHEGFTRFMPAHFLLDNVVVFLGELMHTFFERVDIFLGSGCGRGLRHSRNHYRQPDR